VRSLAVVLKCLGQTAAAAPAADLAAGGVAEAMIRQFLAPCLLSCRETEKIREAVLTAVSQLAQALKRGSSSDREDDVINASTAHAQSVDMLAMSQHEELLHSAIAILQEEYHNLRALHNTRHDGVDKILTKKTNRDINSTWLNQCCQDPGDVLSRILTYFFIADHPGSGSEHFPTWIPDPT
jgi:hypothetical protein